MTSMELLELMGSIRDEYIIEAHEAETPRRLSFRKPLLIAALIAVSMLLVGCTVAYAQGWFGQYFEMESGEPLSQGQQEYLAENEQVIAESQTQNEWTVELRSAITDGTTGYIIVGIIAPEGVDLEPEVVDGHMTERFGPGNSGMNRINLPQDTQWVLTDSLGLSYGSGSFREDGDGKDNTKNMVIRLGKEWYSPNGDSDADIFAPDVEYYIHIENIVREYEDQEYLEELLSTKYAGQTDYMLEPDEARRVLQFETLAEGVWDFTVRFDGRTGQRAQSVELLTEPMKVMGYATRRGELIFENLYDSYQSCEEIEVTSVLLSPLSVIISYESDVNCRFSWKDAEATYVVMKDGSRVETFEGGGGPAPHSEFLEPQAPIVLEEVDHVLLPDGTKIPMP